MRKAKRNKKKSGINNSEQILKMNYFIKIALKSIFNGQL